MQFLPFVLRHIRLAKPRVILALGNTPTKTLLAQIFTALYFVFFFLMPFYSKMDKTKPVPERVTK